MKCVDKTAISLCFVLLLGAVGLAESGKPNIIVLLADDLGYGDVNLELAGADDRFSNPNIKTPSLAKLAAESVVFTDHYAAAPTCSPSRAGLLTGRTPLRLDIPLWISDVGDNGKTFLRGWELTIPELLNKVGYTSLIVGKWHLNGADWESSEAWRGWTGSFPRQQGFRLGLVSKENPHLTRDLQQNTQHRPGDFFSLRGQPLGVLPGWTSQILTDYAIDYVRQLVDRRAPFFLYLAYDAVHEKVDNPPKWNRKYDSGNKNKDRYYANVSHLDHQIGRLLGALDELGIAEDTLVIFSSDNGPEVLNAYWGARRSYGTSYPLKGHKRQLFEGGVRVPGMVRWTGKISPRVSREPNSTLDLLPTLCELAGADVPDDRTVDGASLVPHLLNDEPISRSQPLYWQHELASHWKAIGEGYQRKLDGTRPIRAASVPQVAIRSGDYVLRGMRKRSESPIDFPARFQLFDVRNDPEETRDLVDSRPELFAEMKAEMEKVFLSVQQDREATRRWKEINRPEEQSD